MPTHLDLFSNSNYYLSMRITKLGHCCLLIEENNVRIMTDPGYYSLESNVQENIQILLYTHEHPDHFHLESLLGLRAKNPDMKIITNRGVAKILDEQNIPYELLEHGGSGIW